MSRLTQRTENGASLILDNPKNDYEAQQQVAEKFKQALNKLADYENKEEQGILFELPCKVGDVVYVIPSKCNYQLNVVNRHPENNKICKQVVHSIQMWKPDEWCLWTYDGIILLLQKSYNETWFLTREKAAAKLKEYEQI